MAPVWFAERDGSLLVHSMGDSRKVSNIRENGRFAMTVDHDVAPYRGVTLHGTARVGAEGEHDWNSLLAELAVRHLGDDVGPGYEEFIASIPGEHVLLVLDPADWSAWDYSQA